MYLVYPPSKGSLVGITSFLQRAVLSAAKIVLYCRAQQNRGNLLVQLVESVGVELSNPRCKVCDLLYQHISITNYASSSIIIYIHSVMPITKKN